MRHLFIMNPHAGKYDRSQEMLEKVRFTMAGRREEWDAVRTTGPGHAVALVEEAAQKGDPLRVYACGGDGTLNEVVNGAAGRLLNRALQGTFAPGSTFKMITAIAGLEEGIITPTTEIKDEGIYKYYSSPQPKCWIYNTNGGNHGSINVSEAIEVSCNYFIYEVGRLLGIDTLVDYATRFGLGQKTGLELEEYTGVMASPEYTESRGGTWYEGSVLSVAIGARCRC